MSSILFPCLLIAETSLWYPLYIYFCTIFYSTWHCFSTAFSAHEAWQVFKLQLEFSRNEICENCIAIERGKWKMQKTFAAKLKNSENKKSCQAFHNNNNNSNGNNNFVVDLIRRNRVLTVHVCVCVLRIQNIHDITLSSACQKQNLQGERGRKEVGVRLRVRVRLVASWVCYACYVYVG